MEKPDTLKASDFRGMPFRNGGNIMIFWNVIISIHTYLSYRYRCWTCARLIGKEMFIFSYISEFIHGTFFPKNDDVLNGTGSFFCHLSLVAFDPTK